jgi:hypothetical protein
MKLYFYVLVGLLALTTGLASAQNFPNNGLEVWNTTTGGEKPANWQTTDNILDFLVGAPAGSFQTGAVTKTTDAHSGSFAAKVTTVGVPTTSGGSVPFPGFLVLGNRVVIDADDNILAGLPYTSRPTQMQFYYKLSGTGAATDQAGVQVILSRTSGGNSQVVGGASIAFTAAANTYTLVTLPLQYASSLQPDSITVYCTSGNVATPQVGTTLQLDDFVLSGVPLAVRADANLQNQLLVGPNPSPAGRFVISSPAQPGLAAAPLTVLDVTGRTVVRQPAQTVLSGQRDLDLSALPIGIYTLRLDSKEGVLTRKLVVK